MPFGNSNLSNIDGSTIKLNGSGEIYVDPTALSLSELPIKTILSWAKTLDSSLIPDGWVECNGQVLSDADSPLNGLTMPNLNVTKRFLRGSSTSGTTGGSDTHRHAITSGDGDVGGTQDNDVVPAYTEYESSLPAYYEVVFIIKVRTTTSSVDNPLSPTIYHGTDFTGSNPTKTLTHTRAIAVNTILFVGGRPLFRGVAADSDNEYEITGSNFVMVNVVIDDSDVIMVVER